MSFQAWAETAIFLCYGQDTGIVGDSIDLEYRNCSEVISAGEAIEVPAVAVSSQRGRSSQNPSITPIPIEVEKLFDSASPQLREHALSSQAINGYLVFVEVGVGKNSGPRFKIEFQDASIATIKINFGSESTRIGAEYIKLLPQEISWTVYDSQGKGGEVGSFKWNIAAGIGA